MDLDVVVLRLATNHWEKCVKKKIRHFAPDRNKVVSKEVWKIPEARFIKEGQRPDSRASVVIVALGECMDYKDLNKICPEDCFPLLRIG